MGIGGVSVQSRNNANYQGIDISHYQSGINMSAVNVPVVFFKASEGQQFKDPVFPALYSTAKAAGRLTGVYHFFHVGGKYQVDPQVENLWEVIHGLSLDCKIAVDVEDGGYHGGTQQYVTTAVLDFAAKITAKTGLPCILYSNTAFIRQHFTADIKQLPLWVADYRGGQAPGENGIYSDWVGYQYSSTGSMGGVTVDLNEFTGGVLAKPIVPAPSPVDYKVWPGYGKFRIGAKNDWVTYMGRRLLYHGYGTHYSKGPGPGFTQADIDNYREFQTALGFIGSDADGIPGPKSWVKLSRDEKIIPAYPGAGYFKSGVTSAFTIIVENALVKAGCNGFKATGNPWGDGDFRSYRLFQKVIGDKTLDGIPGPVGWSKLQKYM